MTNIVDNKRIVKNTALLYARTLFVMAVSLYTSRVVLRVLGVDDYAIYQVVGGMVAMFSVFSGSLSVSISRYITYEIGTGNLVRLRSIFSTSLRIQYTMAIIVVIVGEILSIWFVEYKMTVPLERLSATRWVLQFSLLTFCVNLINVPYNACIIAHEKMKAFAYIGIIEVILKLCVCFLILIIPFDRLVIYACLLALISIIIRIIYIRYCHRNFEECSGKASFNNELFKELLSFSGWSFFSNSASILNLQGVTMLINVYFGLVYNAARGLATQVESAVMQFVGNFTTAINPQITKSYAAGEKEEMYKLVCRGSKFSCFAMFFMVIPLILEMEPVLKVWLEEVPQHTVIFAQLSLVMGVLDCMGSSGYTACMATGNLRTYALVITPIGYMEFVFTWVLFRLGAPAVSTYILFIGVKSMVNVARMFLLKKMTGLPVPMYIRNVFMPIISVAVLASLPPLMVNCFFNESFVRIILTGLTSFVSIGIVVYMVGMSSIERNMINRMLSKFKIRHNG